MGKKMARLFLGLFLYSLGIAFTLRADIGYSPYDVLHSGVTNITGITIGMASIFVGVIIIGIAVVLGERLGLATILNMVFIGVFLDFILWTNVIGKADSFAVGLVMLITGLFIISAGSYFYIGAGLGAGPRDSLMVAVNRKTKIPVGACRTLLELLAVVLGWRLGGLLGVGTVISAFAIGFCIQITFKILKFDPKLIEHETLIETFGNKKHGEK